MESDQSQRALFVKTGLDGAAGPLALGWLGAAPIGPALANDGHHLSQATLPCHLLDEADCGLDSCFLGYYSCDPLGPLQAEGIVVHCAY